LYISSEQVLSRDFGGQNDPSNYARDYEWFDSTRLEI